MDENIIRIDGVELEHAFPAQEGSRWICVRPKRVQKRTLRIVTTIPGYPDLGVDESITLPPDAKVYLDGKVIDDRDG